MLVASSVQVQGSTVRGRYPLPRIDDLLDRLHGCKIFSSLDLQAGYPQIRLNDEDKVRLYRYICLWWASERKLGKKPVTKQKNARKIKGTGLGT